MKNKHSRTRILVADRSASNQIAVLNLLQKLGCEVDVADNGAEAILFSRMRMYDLILMNCDMTESGAEFQLGNLLRGRGGLSAAAPIVGISPSGHRVPCPDSGIHDHVPNPITLGGLCSVLDRWLPEPVR